VNDKTKLTPEAEALIEAWDTAPKEERDELCTARRSEVMRAYETASEDEIEPTNAELDEQVLEQDEADDELDGEGVKALKEEKRKTADLLRDIAKQAELFHDIDGCCYADIKVNGHRETWSIRSKAFRRWLIREFITLHDNAPNSNAVQVALEAIEAEAFYGCPQEQVHIRAAEYEGRYYLDLVDEAWQVVEIDADDWRVVTDPPVRFRRTPGMQSLPEPMEGGEINLLRHFLNVKGDDDFVLAVSWTLAALRSRGPYPVIVPLGEHGSGKSTFSRILRSLVDPSKAPLRTMPRDERDLAIAANNAWVIATDNVSSLPTWLSDALCRLSTGGGFSTRTLYTDQDETIFDSTRPIILNGIEEFVTRPDLADRAMLLTLEAIPENKRKSEDELWSDFAAAHPLILGALLDAMVHGLRELPNVKLEKKPRMADFAIWATACETAIWEQGTFLAAYTKNRDDAVISVVEADTIATTVVTFMATRVDWEGTAANLLDELAAVAGEKVSKGKEWPTSPRGLSGRLRRASTFVRKIGIGVAFTREPHTRTRIITLTIEKTGKTPSPPSPSSQGLFFNDLAGTVAGTIQLSQKPPPSPVSSSNNPLKNHKENGGDGGDGRNPTHSSAQCACCGGKPDGKEQEYVVNGETVWLHPECKPFWSKGDGWGVRR
jgi:hypothetical protein